MLHKGTSRRLSVRMEVDMEKGVPHVFIWDGTSLLHIGRSNPLFPLHEHDALILSEDPPIPDSEPIPMDEDTEEEE